MINAYHLYYLSNLLFRFNIPILPKIIKLFIFLIYNSSIPYQCSIGTGTRFAYSGIGVILHKKSVIKKNVLIGSGVVIGGKEGFVNVPVIGNNVKIATGAKILGDITIGNNAIIGANAVVLKNVPDNAVVVGVPARIIKYIE
tara:strand:- start:9758 stop:10183 length:426 start_codon:yes stop_codon:yes gene_type:complete